MNAMPVANQGEGEQQHGNEQQARSLRCINGVAMVRVGIVLPLRRLFQGRHAGIVALQSPGYGAPDALVRVVVDTLSTDEVSAAPRPPMLHYSVVHACAAEQQSSRSLWSF